MTTIRFEQTRNCFWIVSMYRDGVRLDFSADRFDTLPDAQDAHKASGSDADFWFARLRYV